MRVFLSCVSAQFRRCRDELASDLRAKGCTVKVQEDFQQGGFTLIESIQEYISDCDRAIVLLGDAYGHPAEAEVIPASAPPRSYTQWEWFFCRGERLDGTPAAPKPVQLYIASARFLEAHPVAQGDEERSRQAAFVELVKRTGKHNGEFDTLEGLRASVLRDLPAIDGLPRRPRHLPYDSLGALFVGREDFLADLHARLQAEPTRAAAIVAKQAIHGLGGVGKTRLAIEYALRHADQYSALLFVTADSPQALDANLAALAEPAVLDLPEREAREQDVRVAAVLRWLEGLSGWLVILDNVDTPEAAAAVEALVPRLHAGHVLITSRLSAWSAGVDARELDVLDPDDAARFLLERTQGRRPIASDDEAAALRLATTLGGLALALEQAGAFIAKRRVSLADYEARWSAREPAVRAWHDATLMKYPRALAVTWDTSVSQLDAPALALLRLLCWLAPEPLPRAVLETDAARAALAAAVARVVASGERAGGGSEAEASVEAALERLADFSLIKWEAGGALVSVHRLVQDVTRQRLLADERAASLLAMLGVVDAYLRGDPPPDDVRSWPRWRPVQAHVAVLVTLADEAGIAEPTARLMNEYALLLNATSRLAEAEPLMRRVVASFESSPGAGHPNVAAALNNLAQLLMATNRLAEAEPLMRRVVAIFESSFGADHPNLAAALNNLAMLLQDTNRLAEAESIMRRALAIDEASYGPNHPDVARDLNNLATLLQATNRLAEAEPLMRRVVAIVESSLGADHPNVAIALNNLAQLLQATNRLAEAEPLMRRALAIDEASYGPDHTNVAIRLNNLAQLLQATNRLAEAEPLMHRAVAIWESSLGADHPNVATALNNLAQLLQATNRLTDAEPLMRRALTIDEASYGPDHPNVAIRLNNLATLLQATNRLAEAEPLMRRALAIDEASYGPDHPEVATNLNNLATLLQATNRPAEAEPLMRRALAIDEASYGPDHPEVAIDLNNLARLLQDTNRLAEAEPLMRRALAIDEASYGPDHPNVAIRLNNLATLLQDTYRLAEAEPLMRRALTIDEASYGPDHPNVARDLNNLARLLQDTNRLTDAEPLMRRALAIDEASYGPDHPDVATALNNLATLLQATNRLADAEPLMRRALTIDEASYGPDHPRVARDLNNLARLLQATNRLAEAEPLMRRMLTIFLRFTQATGHEHPHLRIALANYAGLLIAMGRTTAEAQAEITALAAPAGVPIPPTDERPAARRRRSLLDRLRRWFGGRT